MNIKSIILQDLFEFSAQGPITEGQKVRELQLSKSQKRRIAARKANKMKNWNNLGVQAVTWL